VGDDVAPTSLNERRGEVVLALVIVLHLILKRCLGDQWGRGGGTSRRAGSPNVECSKYGKAECTNLGRDAKRDFLWHAVVAKALVVPRTSRAAGVKVVLHII